MSIQHANRGIVKKDLQLYYNRENLKSFRGEATTNIAYSTNNYLNSNGNWWVNSGATIFNDNDTSLQKPVILNVDTTNLRIFSSTVTTVGNQHLGSSIIPISPSTQYTMTIYYWFSGTSMQAQPYLRTNVNNNSLGNFAYNGDANYLNWPRRTWIRLSITFTTPSNETGVYMSSYTGDNAGEKLAYFGYQLEQRSYATPLVLGARAIATTNLLTSTYSTLPTNWLVDGSGQGTIGTYTLIDSGTALRVTDIGSNTRFYFLLFSGFSASTTYTFSVKYRKVSGAPTLRFQIQFYNSSNVLVGSAFFPTTSQIHIDDVEGWQLAWYTVTSPAGTAKLTWFIQDGDDYTTYTHVYDIKEPQVQTGVGFSPWTATSYSANTITGNGGLVDLSGNNNNVNLPNVSFDSGGYYFTTAGNNFLNTGITTLPSNTQLTIDVWTKPTSTTQTKTLVSKWGSSGQSNFCFLLFLNWFAQGSIYFLVGDSAGTNYSIHSIPHNLSTSAYSNFTVVYDNGLVSWYRNGVFIQTDTNGNKPLKSVTTAITIGADYDGGNPDTLTRSYDGTIPNVRLYSRPLTSAEVLQNFNATRKTYGL